MQTLVDQHTLELHYLQNRQSLQLIPKVRGNAVELSLTQYRDASPLSQRILAMFRVI